MLLNFTFTFATTSRKVKTSEKMKMVESVESYACEWMNADNGLFIDNAFMTF